MVAEQQLLAYLVNIAPGLFSLPLGQYLYITGVTLESQAAAGGTRIASLCEGAACLAPQPAQSVVNASMQDFALHLGRSERLSY
jgi:hypothetical protein